MKPLFIALFTRYFNQYLDGSKRTEFRRYGKRWNEKTCAIGRPVILSNGYGKYHRVTGKIVGFAKRPGTLQEIYGSEQIDVACIDIELDQEQSA